VTFSKIIINKLMNDPKREFHQIFHNIQKKKKRYISLEFLFSGSDIPNIRYYYDLDEFVISWE
jgi:hypothetical protein